MKHGIMTAEETEVLMLVVSGRSYWKCRIRRVF